MLFFGAALSLPFAPVFALHCPNPCPALSLSRLRTDKIAKIPILYVKNHVMSTELVDINWVKVYITHNRLT